jgi:hypothetical protein
MTKINQKKKEQQSPWQQVLTPEDGQIVTKNMLCNFKV